MSLKHPFVNKEKKINQNNKQTTKKPNQKTTPHNTSTVILTILINLLNSKPKGAQVRSVCQQCNQVALTQLNEQGRIP